MVIDAVAASPGLKDPDGSIVAPFVYVNADPVPINIAQTRSANNIYVIFFIVSSFKQGIDTILKHR